MDSHTRAVGVPRPGREDRAGPISRVYVAETLVQALAINEAEGRTLEVFSTEGD